MNTDEITIILASGSPRRTELLTTAHISHTVLVSDADESTDETDPEKLVKLLSSRKAEAVLTEIRDGVFKERGEEALRALQEERLLVIGADTVVACDAQVLGKPRDEADAARMLKLISGRAHDVFTGVTICGRLPGRDVREIFAERSHVHVMDLSEEEIESYIKTKEPMDKAGAYGIQGSFMKHVTGIEGDYANIVGLPVSRLYRELKSVLGI